MAGTRLTYEHADDESIVRSVDSFVGSVASDSDATAHSDAAASRCCLSHVMAVLF